MISQVAGLGQAIGLPFELKTVNPRAPWRWLPGHWAARLGVLASLDSNDGIHPPWPDLLITCGRRSVAAAIAIKNASGGRTFTVHIQDPRVPPTCFDMVVPPEHDRLRGANVFPTRGALHKLTREALAHAAERFTDAFKAVRKPFVAVLIGGKSRSYDLTAARMRELAMQLKELAAQRGAGLVVTTSRRTGAGKRGDPARRAGRYGRHRLGRDWRKSLPRHAGHGRSDHRDRGLGFDGFRSVLYRQAGLRRQT